MKTYNIKLLNTLTKCECLVVHSFPASHDLYDIRCEIDDEYNTPSTTGYWVLLEIGENQ